MNKAKAKKIAIKIVKNFQGTTMDHFACCLLQKQIEKALHDSD